MKELKIYQNAAVSKLIKRTKDYLEEKGSETIVFQAPTGSGKTFMMAKYIEQIVSEVENDLCFVWISVGKGELHKQSCKSVKNNISSSIEVSLMEEEFFGHRKEINQNEIVFLNWEKIRTREKNTGNWKNIYMKDTEKNNFIEVLENTRNIGRKIVLIIDESHASATSDRAIEIRDEIIKADLTIEMSATPIIREPDTKVTVDSNDVIAEGMIKKEIIINDGIEFIEDNELNSQELIMKLALEKLKETKKLYIEEGASINPLVLIQLPTSEAGKEKLEFVRSYLEKNDITENNGKLAIWLTDEKINTNYDSLMRSDSVVECLVFKQAIDTGWDCPRASILVKFRESNSIVFEIQTLGRILRMPEARHYDNELLNKAYVYTNIKSIEVKKETYNPNIIKTLISKRKEIYEPLKLSSYYKARVDQGDVTTSFYGVFDKHFAEYFGLDLYNSKQDFYNNYEIIKSKGVELQSFDDMDKIINAVTDTFNIDQKTNINANLEINVSFADNDLQNAFDSLIKDNLNGFAPKRSIPTIREIIYKVFYKYLGQLKKRRGFIYIQNIIYKNQNIFSVILDKAIKEYIPVRRFEIENKGFGKINDNWEIQPIKNYNPNTFRKFDSKLSLYQPLYMLVGSNDKFDELEAEFIRYLDSQEDKIEWFWQNGFEHMETNFGIKKDDGSTFQPDFIVKYKDGRIGIFDTKGIGQRELDNQIKHNALYKYIVQERKKGKNLIGGLVVLDRTHFRVNLNENYFPFNEKPDDWEYFENI